MIPSRTAREWAFVILILIIMCSVYDLIQRFPSEVKGLTTGASQAIDGLGKPPTKQVFNDIQNFLKHLRKVAHDEKAAVTNLLAKPAVAAFLKGEPQPTKAEAADKIQAEITRLQKKYAMLTGEGGEARHPQGEGGECGVDGAEVPAPSKL